MAATKWDSYPQSQLTMPRFSLLRHVHGPQPVNFVSNSLVNIHRSSMRHDTVRWMGFSCFCSTLLISDGGILHIYPDMLIAWRSKAMRPPLFCSFLMLLVPQTIASLTCVSTASPDKHHLRSREQVASSQDVGRSP